MIHQHYFPEMSGTARRTKELAENFVKKGHHVSVLTSYPRKFRSLPGTSFKPREQINNVSIYRIKTLFEVKNIVLLRLFSYSAFVIQSVLYALRLSKKSEIVITIAPLSSGIIGALVKIFNKKHHHFDVPDILPDLGISAGMISNNFIIKLLFKLEKWVYKNSDTISTCTKGQLENIKNKGISSEKLTWIPDWIDNSNLFSSDRVLSTELQKNLKNKKIVSFIGNIGALQNPMVFIETMRLLSENNQIHFLFIGDGIMLPKLKSRVAKFNLKNIDFVGRVKREQIPEYMKLSKILVANYLPDKHLNLYIPGKLFEYAISRRPIIMGARGDSETFINKYKLGIAVPPSNADGFKKAILKIINESYSFNPEIVQFMKDYSIDNVTKKYDLIFRKLKP